MLIIKNIEDKIPEIHKRATTMWHPKNEPPLRVMDMEESHLNNAIAYFERNWGNKAIDTAFYKLEVMNNIWMSPFAPSGDGACLALEQEEERWFNNGDPEFVPVLEYSDSHNKVYWLYQTLLKERKIRDWYQFIEDEAKKMDIENEK